MVYKVNFIETFKHEYYVEANSQEEAEELFEDYESSGIIDVFDGVYTEEKIYEQVDDESTIDDYANWVEFVED